MKRICLGLLVLITHQTIPAIDIEDPSFRFPSFEQAAISVNPKEYEKFATPMPDTLMEMVDAYVDQKEELILNLLGFDRIPYSLVLTEADRNMLSMAKSNVSLMDPSSSNYVMRVAEVPGYVLKFTRPHIRAANAAAIAGKEPELNRAEANNDLSSKISQMLSVFKSVDILNFQSPELRLFQTYQMISTIFTVARLEKVKEEYHLDQIMVPKTYVYLFDENQLPHDRNCFIIQEFVQGFALTDKTRLQEIADSPELKDQFMQLLTQLYVAIKAARLWNVTNIMITNDMKATHISGSPVDLQKRDRYVQPAVSVDEQINIVTDAIKNMGIALQSIPEFFDAWQDILMHDHEMTKIARNKKELVKLYPRLKK